MPAKTYWAIKMADMVDDLIRKFPPCGDKGHDELCKQRLDLLEHLLVENSASYATLKRWTETMVLL